MNVVIPRAGIGRAIQETGRSISQVGDAATNLANKIYEQSARVEATQVYSDLDTEVTKNTNEMLAKTNGTDPDYATKIEEANKKIYDKYHTNTSNSLARKIISTAYTRDNARRRQFVDKTLQDTLWKTSIETLKIQTADRVRMAIETGDVTGNAQELQNTLGLQREYFGDRYSEIEREAMSLYYSNAISGGLANPQTRGATIAQLDDPQYKEKYYKHLDAEQIRAVEYHYGRAKKEEQDDQVYSDLYSRFNLGNGKANYAGAIREIRNPRRYSNLDIEQRRKLENMLKAQQGYDEHVRNEYKSKQRDATLDQIYSLVNNGHMTQVIDLIQKSDSLTEAEKFRLQNSLSSSTQTRQTDIHTYLEGVDVVYDANMPMMEKKKWILSNSNRLSMSDQKSLYAIAISDERKVATAAVKDGISILKNAMTMPGMSGPTADARLKRAISIYEKGLQEHADELKTPEAKRDYAYQVLKIPEFTNIDPVADMKTDMQRMRGVGMPTTAPPKATARPKTFAVLPPAAEFTGKILRDTATGIRLKSNGAEWLEVK